MSKVFVSGDLVWQAATYNYYQYIRFDLGGRFNICAIATQGRSQSSEFVSEYYVLWSDDGHTWITYQSDIGEDQVQLMLELIAAF